MHALFTSKKALVYIYPVIWEINLGFRKPFHLTIVAFVGPLLPIDDKKMIAPEHVIEYTLRCGPKSDFLISDLMCPFFSSLISTGYTPATLYCKVVVKIVSL